MMSLNPIHIQPTEDISIYFFTRHGGHSKGDYASLNVGLLVDDDSADVYANRAAISDFLNIAENQLVMLWQIHSDIVINAIDAQKNTIKADGLWTNQANLALGIQTADCMPIMFADVKNNILGACHAGWRGALDNIMEQTIKTMEQQGAKREYIHAFIGPCIHQESYEVDAVFHQNFIKQQAEFAQFFMASTRKEHYMFDLPAFGAYQLKQSAIGQVHPSLWDTKADTNFFSHRRASLEGQTTGRLLSAIIRHG